MRSRHQPDDDGDHQPLSPMRQILAASEVPGMEDSTSLEMRVAAASYILEGLETSTHLVMPAETSEAEEQKKAITKKNSIGLRQADDDDDSASPVEIKKPTKTGFSLFSGRMKMPDLPPDNNNDDNDEESSYPEGLNDQSAQRSRGSSLDDMSTNSNVLLSYLGGSGDEERRRSHNNNSLNAWQPGSLVEQEAHAPPRVRCHSESFSPDQASNVEADAPLGHDVDNEPTGSLVEAKPMSETSTITSTRTTKIMFQNRTVQISIALVVLTFIAVIIGLSVGLTNSDGGGSVPAIEQGGGSTGSPSGTPLEAFFESTLRPMLTRNSVAALAEPNSAQSQAWSWMQSVDLHKNMTDLRLVQRFALASFYYSTDGEEWQKNDAWLTDAHECDWISKADGTICLFDSLLVLDLHDNDLADVLPAEMALLTALRTVDLSSNNLERLPDNLSALSALEQLVMTSNQLSGTIPSSIGMLSSLQTLDLGSNQLSGVLPTEIGNARSLTAIDLHGNNLSGTIPVSIGNLDKTTVLFLQENSLTASIPSELGLLTNLSTLWLQDNDIEGLMPPEVCDVAMDDTGITYFFPVVDCPQQVVCGCCWCSR